MLRKKIVSTKKVFIGQRILCKGKKKFEGCSWLKALNGPRLYLFIGNLAAGANSSFMLQIRKCASWNSHKTGPSHRISYLVGKGRKSTCYLITYIKLRDKFRHGFDSLSDFMQIEWVWYAEIWSLKLNKIIRNCKHQVCFLLMPL